MHVYNVNYIALLSIKDKVLAFINDLSMPHLHVLDT